jgi:histidinol-phosphate aminotransferase
MLKLDFNERCEGTPFWASQALSALDVSSLWRYPDRAPLEKRIAERFDLQPEQVLATNGGDEGIDLVLRLAKRERRSLLLPLPAFSMYRITAARNDVSVIAVEGTCDRRLDLGAVIQPLQATGQLLALTSPNNPTGEVLERERVRKLLLQARAFGNPVLMDEAYAEFAGESVLDLIDEFDNLNVLRSFSKAFGLAGLRVGCLLANARLIDRLRALAAPFNLSTPALTLAQAACSLSAQSEMQSYCQAIRNSRDSLRQELLAAGITVLPSGSNFLLLQLTEARAELVARFLARNGISVRRFSEPELLDCLRVTIPADAQRLRTALLNALQPELLCLDMDGVLIDTRASYDCCVQQTVVALGGDEPSLTALQTLRNRGGFNDDWSLSQALLKQQGIEAAYEDVVARFQQLYLGDDRQLGLRQREQVLLEPATRRRLQDYRYTIVTGRPRDEARDGTAQCQLAPALIASRDDVTTLKPDPEGILLSKTATHSERVWMIGDSVDDMRAAVAAGAVAIGIGLANATALREAGADTVLASINQLELLL